MKEFFSTAFSDFTLIDAIDILIVAFVVYKLIGFVLETRAEQILKGIIILVVTTFLSDVFNLHVLNWLCKGAVTLGAVAILIVLQPELRRALEFMGRGKLVRGKLTPEEKTRNKRIVSSIVKAVEELSRDKTGALIVFERETMLEDIAETGTIIDGEISEQLIGNIFYEGSPLHDGAVIISDGVIYAAGCVLPLTRSQEISKKLGTRHRAGIGITENSDAFVIIVSEETGIISIAEDGRLERFLDTKTVEKRLLDIYLNDDELPGGLSKIPGVKGFFKHMKAQDEMRSKLYGRRREEKDAEK
ncbi:MAG: diadenylate cyclase CdaA [Clostridiales bacterium]|nr:diadenylate cyclase CdaA [Clostridiales bacterium]MDD7035619.1 diadenylate cyclase CdaA [Bacillota bacterium]MDY2920230.1 diadenylate cyclase CdaA [Lentihominibacter sp.]